GWTLISETGVRGLYCGSHLSDTSQDGSYSIAFPDEGENNGFGSTGAAMALPAETPWRTITLGNTLKPIVETTIPYDLVSPLYEASREYIFGKGTWSWIMWQDESMNYDDQVKYIDLASELGFEFILIDAWWDQNIGYNRMEELLSYAKSKNVDVFLWYNSNGSANDAHQTPRNKMNTAIARKKEMQWLKSNGVKGIKVDFFGGDKQETMRLYENILSDANDYGLMCVFHGTTLPRGWERMFPNYVGSEAVLASENLMFSQQANDLEAFSAALHPFIRNAVGSMEFGGVVLNERYNKTNDGGNYRKTTDAFQLATAVLFQNPVQFMALTPNNLDDAPDFEIDFLKNVPTTWEDTQFIAGFPGKYVVLARKNEGIWYVSGVNATAEPMKLKVNLPMFSGKTVVVYSDDKDRKTYKKTETINKKGTLSITIASEGGIVLKEERP
ncbi:MAG: glycoside hydrolase family 97 catalytic domain-containing protein, partial [Leeuwenhoekiella sp.]